MQPHARCVRRHGRWAEMMIDDQRHLPVTHECLSSQCADSCDDEAVVQASLDAALEDLVRAAVEVGSEPYAVSCARIDQAFDDRMVRHRHLTWARLLAKGLKMQLKLGLHRHGSASKSAHQTHGSQLVDMATPSL